MTRIFHCSALNGALVIAFCSTTLGPLTSKQAMAQVIMSTGNQQPYYNSYGAGYTPYQGAYAPYSGANYGYTVYGNGPYVYGSSGAFGGATPGVVYGAPYGAGPRGVGYGGDPYPRAYAPSNARYYSPYGYQNAYGYPSSYGYRRF